MRYVLSTHAQPLALLRLFALSPKSTTGGPMRAAVCALVIACGGDVAGPIDSGPTCIPKCVGTRCGTSDSCSSICLFGSGCCTCIGVKCGAPDNCGQICTDDGCEPKLPQPPVCVPNCHGSICGSGTDGCGAVCQNGSGCTYTGCVPSCICNCAACLFPSSPQCFACMQGCEQQCLQCCSIYEVQHPGDLCAE